ncbi:2-oxo-4-hydroxy-4-carboxy-5-ureidoimidazoline decarboxylase [Defluviimonas sp. SAOS-178_SWC]|uniref:2-oxo-4-hydroxy-4-carboxy-5-ureidoimidazoline decarboxylase n=1 Tax=Defluviimonas sp. SAOS-178_SWC TaxID=3121287 RepID=UPI003221D0D1
MTKLGELNRANPDEVVHLVEPLIERAPAIARRVAARRPFTSTEDLCQAIRAELLNLGEADRIALFRAHPELAPDNPLAMTAESQQEQGRLNLTSGRTAHRDELADLNARYRDKFGFPFIVALVRHADMNSVLREFRARLAQGRDAEIDTAINEIATVSAARVKTAFG